MSDARRPPCVVYVASTSIYSANSRLGLLRRMAEAGWRVVCVASEDAVTPRALDPEMVWRPLPIAREIARPFRHLQLIQSLRSLYLEERPALVHHFTANPVIYGSLAARAAGVPAIVNALPGLGTVFESTHWDAPLLRTWLRSAYRLASRTPNSCTVFQNRDDQEAFVEAGIVARSRAVLIRGSGVDVQRYRPQGEPDGIPTVVLCGRMLRSKGLEELARAARQLRDWQRPCRIRLVGALDESHRGAVPLEQIRQWESEGLLTWDGWRDDVPSVLSSAHLVVLPSHGGEGVPRSLIEGAACGRPLVATDVPGCREIVQHQHNGLLVPPRDGVALAHAIARLLGDADERRRFGDAGRKLAVEHFSEEAVIEATLEVYRRLIEYGGPDVRLASRAAGLELVSQSVEA